MKKLIYVLVAIVVALGLCVVGINAYLNSGKIKQLAIDQVQQHIGRELIIEGDLSLSIYPSLGLKIEKVALKDNPNFSKEDTLSVDSLIVAVQLMPLLSNQLLIDQIALQNPSIRYVTNGQGITNFDDLKAKPNAEEATATSEAPSESNAPSEPWELVLSKLLINDGQVLIDNQGEQTRLGPLQLTINGEGLGKSNRLSLTSPVQVPGASIDLSLMTELVPAEDLSRIDLSQFELSLKGKGDMFVGGKLDTAVDAKGYLDTNASLLNLEGLNLRVDANNKLDGNVQINYAAKPSIVFALASKKLDLRPYMAASDSQSPTDSSTSSTDQSEKEPKEGDSQSAATNQEPDLSVLQSFDLNGSLEVDSLMIEQTTLSVVLAKVVVESGVLKVNTLKAKMFNGSLSAVANLDSNPKPHTAALTLDVKKVAARPMLKAFADFDKLSGNLAIAMDVKVKGLSTPNVRSSLSGPFAFTFADGAYHGVNVAQMIRNAKAAFSGSKSTAAEQEQKTDFSELLLQGNFAKQRANVSKMQMSSPLLRIDGKGNTHLVNESINFNLTTKVVASLEGQGGKNDLEGISIPLHIKGSWSQPSYEVDMKKLLEGSAKKEIQNRLEKELGLDAADDSDPKKQLLKGLGGLLGG
ncbi:AsmA family protein [Alginatibacterium sediminis]|uniref:AsmA family protein n=1 Tax=Alginatibacterium sediminis TaxID=2164068 RepID=A0A420EHI8_9ALTE|nr:AsmA family protein [Alginatibacterium sediminis]RKF20143.1 AsmA family protein [Alginatibacterium sediminis]